MLSISVWLMKMDATSFMNQIQAYFGYLWLDDLVDKTRLSILHRHYEVLFFRHYLLL